MLNTIYCLLGSNSNDNLEISSKNKKSQSQNTAQPLKFINAGTKNLEYVNSVDANGSTNLVYIPFDINSYNFKEFIEIFDFVFFKIENLHTL